MTENISEKNILVNRLISRASSGLYFIDECLTDIHKGGTDAAFSRSIYILFSFNFELILKARVILARKDVTREGLIKGLKHHNLEKISKELSKNELKDINIKTIKKIQNTGFVEYEIKTINREKIIVQDLIDVRYDFTKDNLRNSDPGESKRIKKEVAVLLEIIQKIYKILG